jgi:hypothetical protein
VARRARAAGQAIPEPVEQQGLAERLGHRAWAEQLARARARPAARAATLELRREAPVAAATTAERPTPAPITESAPLGRERSAW